MSGFGLLCAQFVATALVVNAGEHTDVADLVSSGVWRCFTV